MYIMRLGLYEQHKPKTLNHRYRPPILAGTRVLKLDRISRKILFIWVFMERKGPRGGTI